MVDKAYDSSLSWTVKKMFDSRVDPDTAIDRSATPPHRNSRQNARVFTSIWCAHRMTRPIRFVVADPGAAISERA